MAALDPESEADVDRKHGAGQRQCDSCNTSTLLGFSIMSTESPRTGMKRSLIVEHVLHFASSQRKMSPQAFT